jgi:CDP-2,3-bis-(O-geranylgeranyl)-sn-glycerol synthase
VNLFLLAIWFFLPAGAGNAAPIFAAKIPWLKSWDTPMDFGKTFRGKRILGDNKTWRGLLSGALIGGLTAGLQHSLFPGVGPAGWLTLSSAILLGALLGVGALLGDAVESFFKRQSGVQPGQSWFPFDQTDYILGGMLLSSLAVRLNGEQYAAVFVTWFFIHIIATHIGYLLGLKSRPI